MRPRREIDARPVVLPDRRSSHHLVWAGTAPGVRAASAGQDYMEILEAGEAFCPPCGRTCRRLRGTRGKRRRRLLRMAAHGTTTVEGKTGYGSPAPELRMLQVMLALDDHGPLAVVPTFLPAMPSLRNSPGRWTATWASSPRDAAGAACLVGRPRQRRPCLRRCLLRAGAFDLAQTRAILTAAAIWLSAQGPCRRVCQPGRRSAAVELGRVSRSPRPHTAGAPAATGELTTVASHSPAPLRLGETAYAPAGR